MGSSDSTKRRRLSSTTGLSKSLQNSSISLFSYAPGMVLINFLAAARVSASNFVTC